MYKQLVTCTHLENEGVRASVWPLSAAVHSDVFEPLDVRLRVTEHSTHELHITTNDCSLVGRQTGLQDGSVRRTLCSNRGVWKHVRAEEELRAGPELVTLINKSQ